MRHFMYPSTKIFNMSSSDEEIYRKKSSVQLIEIILELKFLLIVVTVR